MSSEQVSVDHRERDLDEDPPRRDGGYRLVAPAVTPLRTRDVAAGLFAHVRGSGRDGFRSDVAELCDARTTATYTSYRRALGACFRELASRTDHAETVLVPAFASSDFAEAIEGVGLSIGRYDVDPSTLAADQASVGEKLDRDVLAVVAVNVLGYTSPMDAMADVCADRNVPLVETLGYAIGSAYRGEPLGSFGDCAVVNFQQGKPVPVGGGMVASHTPAVDLTDDGREAVSPNLVALAGYAALARPRLYYAYAQVERALEGRDMLSDHVTTHPESKLDVDYEPPLATMSNFQAAIGRRVLDRLEDHRSQRERTARYYLDHLADCPGVDRVEAVDGLDDHQHVRYPIVVDSPALRRDVREALSAAGIQARRLYDWPKVDQRRYPGAARLQQGILTLPTHPYVTHDDRRTVVETVRSVAGRA